MYLSTLPVEPDIREEDAGKICADHKATYDRTLEKYKKLQLHTEAVNSENKSLRGLIDDNMRGGDCCASLRQDLATYKQLLNEKDERIRILVGDCCASLRQDLATLNSSYKQLLNEKDERIRILEEKLKKNRKESASEVDSMLVSPEKKLHDRATLRSTATTDSARSVGVNKSPDSTSHTTPQKTDPLGTCGRDEAFCNVVPPGGADEDVVADSPEKSPNSSARLRLQKTRGKRSRYTEEDAPDSKKARQISPKAAPPTTATAERHSKKSKKETSTVLVPDTCFHGLDESFQLNTKSKPPDKYVPGHKSRQDKGKQSRRNTSISGMNYDNLQTIPETLDMFAEFDEASDVEDSQDAGESQGWTVDNAVKKTNGQDTQDIVESQGNIDLDDSFDRLPKKTAPEFAHVTVERKRDERQKLIGHSCKECYDYYKSKGLPEEDMQRQIQKCSRHRAKHLPPDTPPHFWSIGFIDTQECIDRGYMQLEDPDEKDAAPSYRRRRPLEKRFKSKNETATCDADIDD